MICYGRTRRYKYVGRYFNYKGERKKWKEMETQDGGVKICYNTMENTMHQWVEEFPRFRGEEEPSMLDLVLNRK